MTEVPNPAEESGKDDFDPDFDGFSSEGEPVSNKAPVPDGVEEVPQDPNWKPGDK